MELRRWAIDVAVRWPVHHFGGGGYNALQGVGGSCSEYDVDLIGRAQKLLAFVKSAA
jgi:hypothetical protein